MNDGYTKPTKNATHDILNHPMIRELHRRHNDDLVFAGMVLANHHATYEEKADTAFHAARLLRHVVEAEAVVITKDGGGQADVDLMLACRACEEVGLRTVLVAKEESGGDGPGMVDVAPQADAMVSVGNCPEKVRLDESMDQVIGGDAFLGAIEGEVAGRVEIPVQNVIGAIDPIGGSTLTARPG